MAHNKITLPAGGSGESLHTHTNVVDGVTVHNQIMSLGDANNPENTQRIDDYGQAYFRFANGGMEFDSFGNTKVSQVKPLGVYMPKHSKMNGKFLEELSGTSSSVHLPNEAAIKISVGSDSTDSIKRTSHKYHNYISGITNTILMTVSSSDAGKEGLTRRWGYFDANDGIFFEQENGIFNIVLRSSVSGSVVETRIPQSTFNTDTVDGTGTSKVDINLTKSNIFWIDFQWLGVGIVRTGIFGPKGNKITLHEFFNANAKPSIYMRSGSLPVRYEMFNTDITSGTSEMRLLNAVVLVNNSDLKYELKKQATSGIALTNVDSTYQTAMVLRPKQFINGMDSHGAIMPSYINVFSTQPVALLMVKNPDYTNFGSGTWTDGLGVNPIAEYSTDIDVNVAGGIISLGDLLTTEMSNGVQKLDLREDFDYFQEHLSNWVDLRIPDGVTGDTYAILVKALDPLNNANVSLALHWNELHI